MEDNNTPDIFDDRYSPEDIPDLENFLGRKVGESEIHSEDFALEMIEKIYNELILLQK